MLNKSPNQTIIDNRLRDIRRYLFRAWPVCIFCGHVVGGNAQLAHKIRRSYATDRATQTRILNLGLSHPCCHNIFDNKPSQAIRLPLFATTMYDIKQIDGAYFNAVMGNVYENLLISEFNIGRDSLLDLRIRFFNTVSLTLEVFYDKPGTSVTHTDILKSVGYALSL